MKKFALLVALSLLLVGTESLKSCKHGNFKRQDGVKTCYKAVRESCTNGERCALGLKCEDDVCVASTCRAPRCPAGEYRDDCGRTRCYKLEEEACGGVFGECAAGLACTGGTCRQCDNSMIEPACNNTDLQYIDDCGNVRCYKDLGERCHNLAVSHRQCKPGTGCLEEGRVCENRRAFVKQCEHGAYEDKDGKLFCYKGLYGSCGGLYEYGRCAAGLWCKDDEERKQPGFCVPEKCMADCSPVDEKMCTNETRVDECGCKVSYKFEGESCGVVDGECSDDYKCIEGICRSCPAERKQWAGEERCGKNRMYYDQCRSKRCIKESTEGEACGGPHNRGRCVTGAVCNATATETGVCISTKACDEKKHTLNLSPLCADESVVCSDACGRKGCCVQERGQNCGKYPRFRCRAGLSCKKGKCRDPKMLKILATRKPRSSEEAKKLAPTNEHIRREIEAVEKKMNSE